MRRNRCAALATTLLVTLATAIACDPCEPEDCNAGKSDFLLRADDGPLPSGLYAWSIELDDRAMTEGECFVPELATKVECSEDSDPVKAISKDLEIRALKLDLTYRQDGEIVRPEMIRVEITVDDVLALSETYEVEYKMGNTCEGFCPDATVYGTIDEL